MKESESKEHRQDFQTAGCTGVCPCPFSVAEAQEEGVEGSHRGSPETTHLTAALSRSELVTRPRRAGRVPGNSVLPFAQG